MGYFHLLALFSATLLGKCDSEDSNHQISGRTVDTTPGLEQRLILAQPQEIPSEAELDAFNDELDQLFISIYQYNYPFEALESVEGITGPAQQLISITDLFGRAVFSNDEDLVHYVLAEGDSDQTREFINLGLDARSAFLYTLLDLSPEEAISFADSDKPNALLIFPYSDWNYNFSSSEMRELTQKLKESYDLLVKVANQEETFYSALEEVPDAELLILSGHGTASSLSLGETDLSWFPSEKDESYQIDLSDWELEEILNQLHPSAVIFLNSCSNGYGRENLGNLANFIANQAGGRKVISGIDLFSSGEIMINSIYPFDASIIGQPLGTDLTYVTSGQY
ncbi:MAG TPA: hypothetical protein VJA23_01445 [Candidatus Nanoarchaeia archaeon]|nr:hypothetical protein [Candidatus Nanoarchaeia archaeon]